MGKKIKYIKLDADDIMEIVLHYYQEKFNHSEMCIRDSSNTPATNS